MQHHTRLLVWILVCNLVYKPVILESFALYTNIRNWRYKKQDEKVEENHCWDLCDTAVVHVHFIEDLNVYDRNPSAQFLLQPIVVVCENITLFIVYKGV